MKMETQYTKTDGIQQKQLWEKFTEINAYIKKIEKSQINNLTLYIKGLEKKNK